MAYSAVEWHSHAIAEPILHWIGIARSANNQAQARALHNALQNTSNNLPTLSSLGFLLDVYMPGQSDLLFALFLIGVLIAVCLLLLLIVFFILCMSRRNGIIKCGTTWPSSNEYGARAASIAPSSASGVDAFSTDEKAPGRMRCQRVLLCAVCAALWACLAFACALYACALGALASPSPVGPVAVAAQPPADAEQRGDDPLQDDDESGGRFGRDSNNDAATELLHKFEDVRELGYQFHALLGPGAPALFLLFVVFIFYLTTLALSLFATLIGMNRDQSRLYLPGGDHHLMMSATARAATAACNRRTRVRRTLACSAVAFLCAAPLMLALGSVLLVQAHAHLALCVQEQQTAQDLAIGHYVSTNFGIMPPLAAGTDVDNVAAASIALPDFLADLKAERITVNMENCRAELAPINVLWLCSMFLALASVPFCLSVLALLITAKCWSNDEAGHGGISLRAYLPGWVQSSAIGPPDAYKSLAPVVGGQYQHYSISSSKHGGIRPPMTTATTPPGDASQSSFGTFVYKKY